MKPTVEPRRNAAAIARLTQARTRLVTLPALLTREESAFDALALLADAHALVSDAERALAKERFVVLERRYQKEPWGFSDREHRELVTLSTIL